MNRNYLGFEIVKDYFEFANERLENNIYRIKDESLTVKHENVLTLFDKVKKYMSKKKAKPSNKYHD